ncbi:MAG: hypothetical protein ACJ0KI_08205 [Dehalococcoidia bacterium]|tara:strand:- start:10139 stop:10309 length:171 start_codon:yes stop_codon:yes gene_type:complete
MCKERSLNKSYWLRTPQNLQRWEDRGGTWIKSDGTKKTELEVAEEIRRMVEIDPFV